MITKKSLSPHRKGSNPNAANAAQGRPMMKILVNASKLPHDFIPERPQ